MKTFTIRAALSSLHSDSRLLSPDSFWLIADR
jgi:hypothetical protein